MQTFFKRLLQIIENQGFKNLNDFALNGLKYDSSSKLNRLKDEKNKPSVEILLDISNKFQNINLHWLITGKGEMILKKENQSNFVEEPRETIYGKDEAAEKILKINENYNMYQEQHEIQKNMIAMLKEQLAYKEQKLQECEKEKKLLAHIKKMD